MLLIIQQLEVIIHINIWHQTKIWSNLQQRTC